MANSTGEIILQPNPRPQTQIQTIIAIVH